MGSTPTNDAIYAHDANHVNNSKGKRNPRPPVRLAVQSCLNDFRSAVEASAQLSGKICQNNTQHPIHSLLAAEMDKFYIWTSNTSALKQGQASLDYRLCLLPTELGNVELTIQLIRWELRNCIAAIQSPERFLCGRHPGQSIPATTTSETNNADSEEEAAPVPELFDYKAAVEFIHSEIQSLYISAHYFRNAAAINQRMRAKEYSLPLDLYQKDLSEFFGRIIKREFPRISEHLKKRMIGAMLERYLRLYYRTHPSATVETQSRYSLMKKLETKKERSERNDMKLSLFDIDRDTREVAHSSPVAEKQELLPTKGQSGKNHRKHSIFRRVRHHQEAANSSPAAGKQETLPGAAEVKPVTPQHDVDALMPRPPKSCQEGSDFECELCLLRLPSKTGADQSLWSKHVKRDLEAYVCLVDKCDSPYDLYSSPAEWFGHMRSHFSEWVCAFGKENPARFDSAQGLLEHYKTAHPARVPPERLPGFAQTCRQTKKIVFKECPFCDELPTDKLEEHIGNHLRYLAILSIPLPDDSSSKLEGDEDGEHESVVSCMDSAARSLRITQQFDQVSFKHGTQCATSFSSVDACDGASFQHASTRAESPNSAQESSQAPSQHGSQGAGSGKTPPSPSGSAVNVGQDEKSEKEKGIPAGWVMISRNCGRLEEWGFINKISEQHKEWRELQEEWRKLQEERQASNRHEEESRASNRLKLKRFLRRLAVALEIP